MDLQINMTLLYVIELNSRKFYIGTTKSTVHELDNYVSYLKMHAHVKSGIDWIDKYRPLHIYQIVPNATDEELKRFVIQYMDVYGINNVRGWVYTRINLTIKENMIIMREILSSVPFCIECNKNINRLYGCVGCSNKKRWDCILCDNSYTTKEEAYLHEERRHCIKHYGFYSVISHNETI